MLQFGRVLVAAFLTRERRKQLLQRLRRVQFWVKTGDRRDVHQFLSVEKLGGIRFLREIFRIRIAIDARVQLLLRVNNMNTGVSGGESLNGVAEPGRDFPGS